MKKHIMSILVLLFVTTSAYAEPSPSIRYFMIESVSLLDFGIYKLQERMDNDIKIRIDKYIESQGYKKIKENWYYSLCAVEYNYNKNRLNLLCTLTNVKDKLNDKQFKTLSKYIIKLIQSIFRISNGKLKSSELDILFGDPNVGTAYSSLSNYFKHYGYISSERAYNFKELDNITQIIIYGRGMMAKSPLMGTEKDISYKENKK